MYMYLNQWGVKINDAGNVVAADNGMGMWRLMMLKMLLSLLSMEYGTWRSMMQSGWLFIHGGWWWDGMSFVFYEQMNFLSLFGADFMCRWIYSYVVDSNTCMRWISFSMVKLRICSWDFQVTINDAGDLTISTLECRVTWKSCGFYHAEGWSL